LTQGLESCKINPVRELSLNGVKIPESIRIEKKMEKNLTFAYDSVKLFPVCSKQEIEEEDKEVLESQFVTTS